MAFVEDTGAFLSDFGVAATVGGIPMVGIFDDAYSDVLGIVAGTTPVLLVAESDAILVAVGDIASVSDGTYAVAEIQPDGTGMTRLLLKTSNGSFNAGFSGGFGT